MERSGRSTWNPGYAEDRAVLVEPLEAVSARQIGRLLLPDLWVFDHSTTPAFPEDHGIAAVVFRLIDLYQILSIKAVLSLGSPGSLTSFLFPRKKKDGS